MCIIPFPLVSFSGSPFPSRPCRGRTSGRSARGETQTAVPAAPLTGRSSRVPASFTCLVCRVVVAAHSHPAGVPNPAQRPPCWQADRTASPLGASAGPRASPSRAPTGGAAVLRLSPRATWAGTPPAAPRDAGLSCLLRPLWALTGPQLPVSSTTLAVWRGTEQMLCRLCLCRGSSEVSRDGTGGDISGRRAAEAEHPSHHTLSGTRCPGVRSP